MRWGVAVALAVAAGGGCSAPAGPPPGRAGLEPRPTRAQIAQLALRADELRIASLGEGTALGPAGIVTGPAEGLLRQNRTRSRLLRQHLDVIVIARVLVHWSASDGAGLAVVATSGRQRLAGEGVASAWDNFADQWQYTLRWAGGWRVWDAVELPPGQWWPA